MTKVEIKTQILKDVVKAVKVMQDKANLKFADDGLRAVVVSLDSTAMVGVFVPKEQFEVYEPNTSFNEMGLDMVKFGEKLALCGEKVSLEVAEQVKLRSGDKKFGVHCTLVTGSKNFPNLTPAVKLSMKLSELRDIADTVKAVATKMKVVSDGKTVTFSGKDNDFFDENAEIQRTIVGLDGVGESHYTLDYFIPMIKSVDVETVTLEFTSNLPLKITLGNVVHILGAWISK